MKLLKIIATILLVLTVGFFSMGWFNPTINYYTVTEIEAPVEIVWALFTDETKMEQWMPGLESIEHISGEKGQAGSTYKVRFLMDGTQVEMTETITAVDERNSFLFTMEGDDLTSTSQVMFERVDPMNTKMITFNEVNPKGWVNQSIFYLFESTFTKQAEIQYGLFKELCESRRK